jgi:uncharacterized membrane protein YkgB
MTLRAVDLQLIHITRKYAETASRVALFVVFFWFGILKVLGFSPAEGLVKNLLAQTVPFMDPQTFVVCFGIFEMIIGVLFLIRGMERVVIPLLAFHMVTTFLPLVLLTSVTWLYPFVPTLEGQYIIKNLLIIAIAIGIAAHLHPFGRAKINHS